MGVRRYFTGLACPRGHVAERFVSTRACTQCMCEKAADWKRDNPERHAAQHRAWVQVNPEKAKALKLAEQKRNRESANERNRRYAANNREALRAKNIAWANANPGKCTARAAKRRAAVLQRTPPWADLDAISGMYELAQLFRATGMQIEVDHAVPLQGRKVSGLHVHDNLQLISSFENRSKSNRFAVL